MGDDIVAVGFVARLDLLRKQHVDLCDVLDTCKRKDSLDRPFLSRSPMIWTDCATCVCNCERLVSMAKNQGNLRRSLRLRVPGVVLYFVIASPCFEVMRTETGGMARVGR